ncbi:MAG: hypothetical protein K2V38_18300, partial [Gemmataceae bacterium]|nr:hypothetical protein [Gemmataceae bacterium]
ARRPEVPEPNPVFSDVPGSRTCSPELACRRISGISLAILINDRRRTRPQQRRVRPLLTPAQPTRNCWFRPPDLPRESRG